MVSDKSVGFSTVARIRSGRLKPLREGEAWKFFSSRPKLPCSKPHSFYLVVLLASGDESNSSSAYQVGRAPAFLLTLSNSPSLGTPGCGQTASDSSLVEIHLDSD